APAQVYGRLARHLPAGLAPGPHAAALEAAFRELTGAAKACALPAARVALRFVFEALDLPPGSEVAMTPVTIPDVVNAVRIAGLRPRFVDLAPGSCNLDLDAIARAVGPQTRALLLTDLCGIPSDLDAVRAAAERLGLV